MPGSLPNRLILVFGLLALPSWGADSTPPSAHKVTLVDDKLTPAAAAKAIRDHAGIEVDVSALNPSKTFSLNLKNADFWTAVGRVADATGSKVVTSGGRVALRPGQSLSPVHVHGPFRFTFREGNARIDPETGKSAYEITLDVCWEPWLLAYRIDSTPGVIK